MISNKNTNNYKLYSDFDKTLYIDLRIEQFF